MKYVQYVSMFLCTLLLIACNTAPPVIHEKISYVFVSVPSALTEHVKQMQPMDAVEYSRLSSSDQENTQYQLLQSHIATIGVCNARLRGIADWSQQQTEIYKDK